MEKVYSHNTYESKIHSTSFSIIKRSLDILFSISLLIPSIPILLIASLLIMIDNPGSPLYFQERLGIHGKTFRIIKLRSMIHNAEIDGIQWATVNDPRVTRIGKWIRRTRIDELPQLINILLGDMSFIGPRPERGFFYTHFSKDYPLFSSRLMVKPGLTGWAQVNGGYDLSPNEKLQYDLYYIKHSSIYLELKILLKTIHIIFTGKGAR